MCYNGYYVKLLSKGETYEKAIFLTDWFVRCFIWLSS